MTSFLLNTWYMGAWSSEIAPGGTFSRKILDDQVMFYRSEEGKLAALTDRCPHRFAPLSAGKVKGERIECPYHGLQFDSKGGCVHNPQGPAPSASQVRSYVVAEQQGIVWIWPGEASRASVDTIPRIPMRGDLDRKSLDGYSFLNAEYQLAIDNLLDLTHISFLHPAFGGESFQPKVKVTQDGDRIYSEYRALDWPNSEYGDIYFPDLPPQIDEVDTMSWQAPSICNLRIQISPVGELETGSRSNYDTHIVTPETATTSHYFWSTCFAADTAASDETVRDLLIQAFDKEDKPMLEMVQRSMGDAEFWSMNPILLKGDSAAVRARRTLKKMIEEEQKVASPVA